MATDAELRERGLKYLPQQKYLQNPYELPEEEEEKKEETVPVQDGILNTNAFTNSGNNFNVYNPDPNTLSSYRPNYDYRRFSEPDQSMIEMGRNQDYFYKPPVNPRIENILNRVPYLGPVKKGVKFLSSQISPYLSVSRRSILENELAGQGIMVDDIGRIVRGAGDYDTVGNVMAGYGAGQITQKTIDKRKGTIEKTLADKYNMSPIDIAAVKAGTYKGEVLNKTDLISRYGALDEFGNTLNLTNTKVDKIKDFEEEEKEKKKKDTIIGKYLTERKEKKAAKEAEVAADDAVTAATTSGTTNSDGFTYDTNTTGQAKTSSGGTYKSTVTPQQAQDNQDRGRGQQDIESQTNSQAGSGGFYDDFAKGGRAGYFFGGRARLQGGGGAGMGATEKAAERASKGYGTTPDTGSKSGTNDYSTAEQTRNNYRSIVKNQNPTPKQSILDKTLDLGSEVNYLKNLYKMDPVGLSIGFGVNKLRTYIKNKNLPEEDKLSALPTNNYMAKVSKQDLAKYSQQKDLIDQQDYPNAMDTTFFGSEITPYEFQEMKKGNITEPGTYVGADGGRVYLVNGGLAGLL